MPDAPLPGTLIRCTQWSGCSGHPHGTVIPGQLAVVVSWKDRHHYHHVYLPEQTCSEEWANFWDFWEVVGTPDQLDDEQKLAIVKAIMTYNALT